jgi:hypothetical protein
MGNVTNVKIKACDVTWDGEDLGYIDSEIEVSTEESVFDVTTHQTGTQVIGNIRTGFSAEVTLGLKESDVAKLKKIITASGDTHTVGSEELFGWGTSKQFTGTFADAKTLVLHPKANGEDKSEDWNFWKAYPMIDGSLTFSGESAQIIPVKFKVYMDDTKPDEINMFAIGDGSLLDEAGEAPPLEGGGGNDDL